MAKKLRPRARKQPASIELVVLGLLAALVGVLAMPLFSGSASAPAEMTQSQK